MSVARHTGTQKEVTTTTPDGSSGPELLSKRPDTALPSAYRTYPYQGARTSWTVTVRRSWLQSSGRPKGLEQYVDVRSREVRRVCGQATNSRSPKAVFFTTAPTRRSGFWERWVRSPIPLAIAHPPPPFHPFHPPSNPPSFLSLPSQSLSSLQAHPPTTIHSRPSLFCPVGSASTWLAPLASRSRSILVRPVVFRRLYFLPSIFSNKSSSDRLCSPTQKRPHKRRRRGYRRRFHPKFDIQVNRPAICFAWFSCAKVTG